MEKKIKISQCEQFDLAGVSKKGCSDLVTCGNNQYVVVGTNKHLYKLQNIDGRYFINSVKNFPKHEDEDFVLVGCAQMNNEETYIYVCTSNEKDDLHHLMVFRNDFRDLIETITLPFKPIRTEPIVAFERLYIFVGGENTFQRNKQKEC